MRNKLTQERIKEVINYCPDTGIFTWLKPKQNCKVGDVAGCINGHGYMRVTIDSEYCISSRLAFLYMEGYWPENEVDHINHKKDDNRWCNLRHVSRQCNAKNRILSSKSVSGVTGVAFAKDRKKWKAYISVNKRQQSLGYYKTLKNAVEARLEAEKKYNYPDCNSSSTAFLYLKGIE